jgi:DNA polymerase-1
MEKTINNARIDGSVKTLLGRNISIYGIKDDNKRLASFGERAAINAPIQGTAADIIKLAMIKTYNILQEKNLKTKMLLQVHDELVFESPVEEVEIVSDLIKQTMQDITALHLSVPLITEVGIGDNWEEAH